MQSKKATLRSDLMQTLEYDDREQRLIQSLLSLPQQR